MVDCQNDLESRIVSQQGLNDILLCPEPSPVAPLDGVVVRGKHVVDVNDDSWRQRRHGLQQEKRNVTARPHDMRGVDEEYVVRTKLPKDPGSNIFHAFANHCHPKPLEVRRLVRLNGDKISGMPFRSVQRERVSGEARGFSTPDLNHTLWLQVPEKTVVNGAVKRRERYVVVVGRQRSVRLRPYRSQLLSVVELGEKLQLLAHAQIYSGKLSLATPV